ncbi:MAG: gamma-glutamyl-gamma-aminobutyrate hydrolase family protein [Lachnospiraceae bacterium]|jgi:putative glutamine amidotransferase|nr:gamma-glutamyl-gamma-aminobutyrate hydrolase family protein [Lachnospiraceae bacterium]
MKKPIIGLTPYHNTENDDISMRPGYIRALEAAGAIPMILPLEIEKDNLNALSNLCQGFLFTGGPDPHPFLWGEETHKNCGPISVKRDQMELSLLTMAMEQKKPILGICRGAQILNIGLGGDIYQDISSQYRSAFPIAHSQPMHYRHPSHHVDVKKDTRLASFGDDTTIQVNSCHHQAIRKLAPGLIAGGMASDGIIEEIELPEYPFLIGVQWHPEYLWETDSSARNLFLGFVNACKEIL